MGNSLLWLMLVGGILYLHCTSKQSQASLQRDAGELLKSPGTLVSSIGESIQVIYQDSQGRYWFGGVGLVCFDGKNIISYTAEDGLLADRVRGIQEDKEGRIYLDTGGKIFRFDGKSIEKIVIRSGMLLDWHLDPEDLWFEGFWNTNTVLRYDGQHLYELALPRHPLEQEFYRLNPQATFNPYDVYTIYRDRNGHVWMGTSTFGACRFDGKAVDWLPALETMEIDPGPAPGVRSIVEDKNGCYWFSNQLIYKYCIPEYDADSDTDTLSYTERKTIDSTMISEDRSCISMIRDRQEAMWLAESNGLVRKYDGDTIMSYRIYDRYKSVELSSLYEDREGKVWLGTNNAGVYRYEHGTFVRFDP